MTAVLVAAVVLWCAVAVAAAVIAGPALAHAERADRARRPRTLED